MEFTCQTIYHQKSLTILTRALRKTIRRKTSRQMRIISWGIIVIELVSLLSSLHTRWLAVGNGLVVVSLLLLLWKEDAFNAFFAKRKQLPEPIHAPRLSTLTTMKPALPVPAPSGSTAGSWRWRRARITLFSSWEGITLRLTISGSSPVGLQMSSAAS